MPAILYQSRKKASVDLQQNFGLIISYRQMHFVLSRTSKHFMHAYRPEEARGQVARGWMLTCIFLGFDWLYQNALHAKSILQVSPPLVPILRYPKFNSFGLLDMVTLVYLRKPPNLESTFVPLSICHASVGEECAAALSMPTMW